MNSFTKQVASALQRTVNLFEQTCKEQCKAPSHNSSAFDGRDFDKLSRLDLYVDHISKYFQASESMLVVALIYIDRFNKATNLLLSPKNVHRIFLTAYLCAVKFHEDRFYRNTYYAQCGAVSIQELNHLERLFLKKINFTLRVLPSKYNEYLRAIITLSENSNENCVNSKNNHHLDEKPTHNNHNKFGNSHSNSTNASHNGYNSSNRTVRRSPSDASTAVGTTASEISSDDASNRFRTYGNKKSKVPERPRMQSITSGDESEGDDSDSDSFDTESNSRLRMVPEEDELEDVDVFEEDDVEHDSDLSDNETENIDVEAEDRELDEVFVEMGRAGVQDGETVEISVEDDYEMEMEIEDEVQTVPLDQVVEAMLDDLSMDVDMGAEAVAQEQQFFVF